MYHRNHLILQPNKRSLRELNSTVSEMALDRASKPTMTFDEQIEMLTKLKSLLDAGILSQDEFDQKKKEIMDL